MAHRVEIRGADGELRWGYQRAVALRDFHVTREPTGGWSLTGTIAHRDDYAVTQGPLVFCIPGRGWRWDVITLQVADSTLTAVLGPQM